jgi:basic amino acid/polyamine antiporter, APA family
MSDTRVDGNRRGLLRILGLGFGVAVLFGGTVGVGIMRTSGATAGRLGDPALIYAVWAGIGLFVLIAANSLAELGTAIPRAGGPYVYVQRAFGNYVGFVSGWGDFSIQMLASGYLAMAAGEFSASLWPALAGHEATLATLLILLSTGVHALGLRASSLGQQWLSAAKALLVVGLIVAAFLADVPAPAVAATATASAVHAATGLAALVPLIVSMEVVVEVYGGYNSACYFAEETQDAARTLPRSLLIGVLAVIAVYLAMNGALLHLMTPAELGHSKLAAADALARAYGPMAYKAVTVVAIVATLGVLLSTLLMAPRVLLAMGRDGLFLRAGARISERGVPSAALWLTSACSIVTVYAGGFDTLYAATGFLNACDILLCGLALFVLRAREPALARPYRAWGYPWVPGIGVAVAALLLVAFILGNRTPSLLGLLFVAIATPVYLVMRQLRAGAHPG